MARHHRFIAWQRAHELTTAVYRCSAAWPAQERFNLTAQVRSAVVSVSANIAEGAAREGPREFYRFLRISMGSLAELEYELQLAAELGYVDEQQANELAKLHTETGKLLSGLARSLKRARN